MKKLTQEQLASTQGGFLLHFTCVLGLFLLGLGIGYVIGEKLAELFN